MYSQDKFTKIIALTLLFATTLATMPVSAAELSTPSALGSVSVVGPVDLRGIRISGEGTVFACDQLRVGDKAYAKLMLVDGNKIELAEKSNLTLQRQGQAVQINLQSGNVAFTSPSASPLVVVMGGYEITSKKPLVGNIAFIGTDFVGVRVISGNALVRNLKTKESYSVSGGQERLLSLTTSGTKEPLTQLASSLPGPIPSLPSPPQSGTAGAAGGQGLSTTGWLAILGTIGGAATAIAVLATNGGDEKGSMSQQQALANLQAISTTAQQTSTAAAQTATVASQANAAIQTAATLTDAQKAQLTSQAQTITSQAQTASSRVSSLTTTISQLQSRFSGSGSLSATDQAALDGALAELEAARLATNTALQQLRALLTELGNDGVQNLPPPPNVIVIPPANVASLSVPA